MAAQSGSSSSVPSLPPPRPKSPPQYPDLYGKRRETAKVQMLEREIGFLESMIKDKLCTCVLQKLLAVETDCPIGLLGNNEIVGGLVQFPTEHSEIGLTVTDAIEEELKSVQSLQPASRCCKEITEYVVANSDPFIPTNRKIRRPCRFWKWLCGMPCFNLSWICCCCCTGCSLHLEMPRCGCNCNPCNYCNCNPCNSCCCNPCNSCCCNPCNWFSCVGCHFPKWRCCSCPRSNCCKKVSCRRNRCRNCCCIPSLSCPDCSCCTCTCSCSCPKCPKVRPCCCFTKTCCNPFYLCY